MSFCCVPLKTVQVTTKRKRMKRKIRGRGSFAVAPAFKKSTDTCGQS